MVLLNKNKCVIVFEVIISNNFAASVSEGIENKPLKRNLKYSIYG